MAFLHTHCISGPIQSRRLGVSLGVNLLPTGRKICNYNCAYCECGLNEAAAKNETADEAAAKAQAQGELPTPDEIEAALDQRLRELKSEGCRLDSLTFSGNGEPTLHPQFEEIMQRVADVRHRLSPHTPITVLSNAALLHRDTVRRAIGLADKRMLKLDAAGQALYSLINAPRQDTPSLESLIENLRTLPYPFTIQTLLLRGSVDSKASGKIGSQVSSRADDQIGSVPIDNTTKEALDAYLDVLRIIQPTDVVLYGLDRETPEKKLQKLSEKELKEVALRLRSAGAPPVQYYY